MITRLLLCGMLMIYRVHSFSKIECKTRVDVLNGNDLSEGLGIFLTTKVSASSPSQCAIQCFQQKCDVAYFHWNSRQCQFTANSSSNSGLHCEDYQANRLVDDNPDVDTTQRFCIKCKILTTNQVFANTLAKTSDVMPAPKARQLKYYAIPTRPGHVNVDWHPAEATRWRDRRIVHTIAVPPRPVKRLSFARTSQPISYSMDSVVQTHKISLPHLSRSKIYHVAGGSTDLKFHKGISRYRPRGTLTKLKTGRYFHHSMNRQHVHLKSLKTKGTGIA